MDRFRKGTAAGATRQRWRLSNDKARATRTDEMASKAPVRPDSPRIIRTPTIAELEQALKIDKDALEHECMIQPDMFYNVAKMLALETSRRDEAANTLKDVEAEIDQDIRTTAAKEGDKTTEKEIESLKRLDKDVQIARRNYADLEYKVARLQALTESWRKRNDMLKLLAQLYVATYFGDVNVRTDDVKTVRANRAKAMLGEQYRHERGKDEP